MKTAKIGALFLVALMALTGASAGYALWSDTLTVSGTVNTGTFNVDWSIENVRDSEIPGKDVSYVEWPPTISSDGKTMTVVIQKAYPCIDYYIDFDLHSTGTVPAHFTGWTVQTSDSCVEVTCPSLAGVQLHYLDSYHGTIKVHLTNDAHESTPYTFTITVMAYQYNEFTDGTPNPAYHT